MASKNHEQPTLHALLIAADCYLPNRLPEGSYPNLGGCVRDVQLVEDFLRERLHLKEDRLVKLTSTNVGTSAPPEPPERRPTYENIIAAFKDLTQKADPGDHVYVHYSGHGGRTTTLLPEVKGKAASTRPSSRSTSATPRPAMSAMLKSPSSFRTWSPRG